MAAAIALRDDFDGPALRRLAKGTKDAAQARRLLALAEIRDGGSRSDAARVGGGRRGRVADDPRLAARQRLLANARGGFCASTPGGLPG